MHTRNPSLKSPSKISSSQAPQASNITHDTQIKSGEVDPSIEPHTIDLGSVASSKQELDIAENMPQHLVKEFKLTYSNQISLENYLIFKVKEMEKENRLLKN